MVNIKISNRLLYTFIAIIMIIAIIGIVYAYAIPSVGHSADEISPGKMQGPIKIAGELNVIYDSDAPTDGRILEEGKPLCKSDGTECNFLPSMFFGLCIEKVDSYSRSCSTYLYQKPAIEPAYCNSYNVCECREGYRIVPMGTVFSTYHTDNYYTCMKE